MFEIAYLLALLIGLVLGLVGSGGSIVTMPVLVYVFNINPVAATTYSLFIVGTAALAGSIQSHIKRNVHLPSTFLFGLSSIGSVLLVRRFVLHRLPETIFITDTFYLPRDKSLMVGFAMLMLAAAYSIIKRTDEEDKIVVQPNPVMLCVWGFGVGIITGLVGAGGGFLIVPALVFYAGLPIRKAIGTSLSIITINSYSGFLSDIFYLRNIDWIFLFVFAGIAAIGIFIGASISKFLPTHILRRVFAVFVICMAAYILLHEFYLQ